MEKVKRIIVLLVFAISCVAYFLIAFYVKRTDHFLLFSLFVALVLFYSTTIFLKSKSNSWLLILFFSGLVFRGLFLIATPKLSDDFFRFTWDGELMSDGVSPFEFQPRFYQEKFIDSPELQEKYEDLLNASTEDFPNGMNSKQYYSIYPTFNQLVFYCSSWVSSPNDWNLSFIRVLLILADIVSFFVLRRLLLHYKKSEFIALLYWLNPMVIIEITGNLHFEGFAIMFMILGLWLLERKRYFSSAVAVVFSIVTKLNPIFFLGAVFSDLGFKKGIKYGVSVVILTIIMFVLIFDLTYFHNFTKSFGLYFAWFEFNGGLYEFCNQLSLLFIGSRASSTLSIVFPLITVFLMLKVVFFSDAMNKAEKLAFLFLIYFSFSPIVHPWYALLLLPFGILSGRLYTLVWSITAFFSYSAYKTGHFEQDLWVVFLEYLVVYSVLFFEYKTTYLDGLQKRIFS